MKSITLFLFAAASTACLSYSSRPVVGADPKKPQERPLALNSKAIVAGCEVTGQLVRKHDGVYAVLDCYNPNEDEAGVQFNLAVHRTPAASPMMRMLPMPSMIQQQHIDYRLAAGERRKTEILVKKAEGVAMAHPVINELSQPKELKVLAMGKPAWSLAISREEITGAPGWGGAAPVVPGPGEVVLGKGILVLTRCLEEEPNGAS